MSWLNTKLSEKAERLAVTILSAGPVPRHVAFVMDGNRRYARMNQKEVIQGHRDGFQALRKILDVCFHLGIKCVSAYAFSIENFKRSKVEVDGLMNLFEEKLVELSRKGDLLEEYDVRLRIIGNTPMLPPSVQEIVARVENMTVGHKRSTLNLCIPYTSRDEITSAVQASVQEALAKNPTPGSDYVITEEDIEAHLMTSGCPPLDILIRTSGVKRLSDFMLWQCSENVQIQFTNAYWPEFGLWDFLPILLDYQRKIYAGPSTSQ